MQTTRMKRFLSTSILLICLACLSLPCEACRFTVREIGFSSLSPTVYTLVVVDNTVTMNHPVIAQLSATLKGSNMQVLALNAQKDAGHPFLQRGKEAGLVFPTAFLISEDERLCPLFEDQAYAVSKLVRVAEQTIVQSPLRRKLLAGIAETFAYVIRIPGMNPQENERVDTQIQADCARVKDIMFLMPKSVEKPPHTFSLTADECKQERVVLWSLGLDSLPTHPIVHILYGRGRYMGNGLHMADVMNGHAYRYLAMVGADCECNLDRDWMLGTQIPMLWEASTSQRLATSLDFDVDNPLIQAEMSRILSKEEPGGNSTISFTPETIDLDHVFDTTDKPQSAEVELTDSADSKTVQVLWLTLGILLVIVVGVSVYVIKK